MHVYYHKSDCKSSSVFLGHMQIKQVLLQRVAVKLFIIQKLKHKQVNNWHEGTTTETKIFLIFSLMLLPRPDRSLKENCCISFPPVALRVTGRTTATAVNVSSAAI